jgi:hypothetical protein
MVTRGDKVFRQIIPLPQLTSDPPVTNDIMIYALFARITLTNNNIIEFETKFHRDTNTIELVVPAEAMPLLDQITGIQRGPVFKRFIDWLIGSQSIIPATLRDGEFVSSSDIAIWFGGTRAVIDEKMILNLPAADMSTIGYNLKTSSIITAGTKLKIYLVWTYNCGSNTSFTIRTNARVTQIDGTIQDVAGDADISTFNLISGDIRETLLLEMTDIHPNDIISLLFLRNFPTTPEPKTDSIGVIGLRFVFEAL